MSDELQGPDVIYVATVVAPSSRATVAEWQAYASSQGIDPEGMTKAELIDAVEALEADGSRAEPDHMVVAAPVERHYSADEIIDLNERAKALGYVIRTNGDTYDLVYADTLTQVAADWSNPEGYGLTLQALVDVITAQESPRYTQPTER